MTERLDPVAVREVVEAQFPELSVAVVDYLGEGCDSVAFEVNGAWVFRFPKRPDVETQLLKELRVLPALSVHLPVPVPVYRFHGRPGAGFPRHFGGYAKLPGVPGIQLAPSWLESSMAAAELGRFLSRLHAFPIDEAARLGIREEQNDQLIDEIRAEALSDFESVRGVAPDAPLERWRAYLEAGVDSAARRPRLPPCLAHNDLAAEHVLCDPAAGSVTGIIDWSDIAIGDSAVDLAALFHWGGDNVAARVLRHYERPVDDRCLARARFIAACRGVGDVKFGLDTGRREYVSGGIRALASVVRG